MTGSGGSGRRGPRAARPVTPPSLFETTETTAPRRTASVRRRAALTPRPLAESTPAPAFSEAGPPAVTVSEFTRALKSLLADAFPYVRVTGEVSGLHRAPSGHVYFTLKDSAAELRCVMWRPQAARAGAVLADGLSCEVRGAVTVYEPRGTYQLTVEEVVPLGLGALMAALDALKARLLDEGLFAAERKRPIPRYPRHVGLVTSPTGAAVYDMIRVLHQRMPSLGITVVPTLVQGAGASQQIADAIDRANAMGGFDVLIVGRGGGAIEDLWAFNEEPVARAVVRSAIPVVSAVGHERDVTLIDYIADVRAPTPTGAAQLVVRDRDDVRTEVDHLLRRAARAILTRVRHERQRLARMTERYGFRQPRDLLRQRAQRIDELALRLRRAGRAALERQRTRHTQLAVRVATAGPRAARVPQRAQAIAFARTSLARALRAQLAARRARLQAARGALEALAPTRVLARGYAIVEHGDAVLTRAADARAGLALRLRFHDGHVPATAGTPELDPPGDA